MALPLDEEGLTFHHGAACYGAQPMRLMREMLSYYGLEKTEVICRCEVPLYIADPRTVDLVKGNVVAVGGAAGCVHPTTGEGILPSMETAKLLASTLNEGQPLEKYAASVRKLLEKYNMAYSIVYRWFVSPLWAWASGIRYNSMKAVENFDPAPPFGTTIKLIARGMAIFLSTSES